MSGTFTIVKELAEIHVKNEKSKKPVEQKGGIPGVTIQRYNEVLE